MKGRSKALAAGFGFAATVAFALYNGFLGARYRSLWHGSICVYYVLLSVVRGVLLAAEHSSQKEDGRAAGRYRRGIFFVTSGLMLAMSAALVVPVSLMVLDQRPVRMGMIPAITSATYTTYKVSAAAVRLKRTGGSIFMRELNVLRFVDALVSILVLQNSLITAVDGEISGDMFSLVAVSSAGALLFIFALLMLWLIRGSKETDRL